MKVLLVNELNGDIAELANYGGFVDSSVVAYIKSHYIQSLSWNNETSKLDYSFGENWPGTTYSLTIYPNACRYHHEYTIRPTSEFAYMTISFSIDTNINHPLSVNELRNWFFASNLWDIRSVNYIGKKMLSASGIAAISNNVPYVVTGLAYYAESEGMIINLTLFAYCNYGSYFSVDEDTLSCSCILDIFTGQRIV